MLHESGRGWAWGWKSLAYYRDIEKSRFYELDFDDETFPEIQLEIETRKPRVIEFQPGEERAMYFLIYDDDRTWRLLRCEIGLSEYVLTAEPICSPAIDWRASLQEIRNLVGPVVNPFPSLFLPDAADDISSSCHLHLTYEIYQKFQMDMCRVLKRMIEGASLELKRKISISIKSRVGGRN